MSRSRIATCRAGSNQTLRRVLAGLLVAFQLGQGAAFAQGGAVAADPMAAPPEAPTVTRTSLPVAFGSQAPAGPRPTVFHDALAAATQSRTAPPRGNWATRHPVLLGTLIGASGGLVWQAAGCRGSSCKPGAAAL